MSSRRSAHRGRARHALTQGDSHLAVGLTLGVVSIALLTLAASMAHYGWWLPWP